MKIAVDCRMIGSGGIGTYLESILPYILEKTECLLFGPLDKVNHFNSYKNASILECNVGTFSLNELLTFPKKLIKEINSCNVYYSPYCNIPKGIKIPIYTTIHDVVFLDIKNLSSKIGTFIRKQFYLRAVRKSKAIFTVSNFSASRIKVHLKTKKPIIVTYNSAPEWFVRSHPTPQKQPVILFVGNIKKHKGLHLLVSSFNKALEKGLKATLLIVGNANNFRSGDSSIFNEISQNDKIRFTGKISDNELKSIYETSSLLIQPSLYEGFGMPPLEALTMGTNVIISDIPVFKEIYKNFPVIYFKSEDSDDLTNKILDNFNNPLPENIPEIYSFRKTSDIILNTILNKENK